MLEAGSVAGGDGGPVGEGDGGDHGIGGSDGAAEGTAPGRDRGEGGGGGLVEGEDADVEPVDEAVDRGGEGIAAAAKRELFHAVQEFSHRDGGEVEGFPILGIDPAGDPGVRRIPQGFGHHVGVEDGHSPQGCGLGPNR